MQHAKCEHCGATVQTDNIDRFTCPACGKVNGGFTKVINSSGKEYPYEDAHESLIGQKVKIVQPGRDVTIKVAGVA